jgi:hypothetical protein
MGARYLRQQVIPNSDWAAGSFGPRDLPVNPLSFLLVGLELTNANPSALLTYSAIDDAIDNVTSIIVKHKGENIIQGNLRDLMVMNAVQFGAFPGWDRLTDANGGIRRLIFPLCFGRRMFDPKECFPATTRGNLTFEATRAANPAGFSDVNLILESVELIEADPEAFCKYTTQALTPGATGLFDLPLPIGNPLLALLLFDTAIATLTTATSSWGQTKLLKDNVEQMIALADFQMLAGMLNSKAGQFLETYPGHIHQINDGAALSNSDDAKTPVSTGFRGYGLIDFDPLGDMTYMLETEGAADLKLRGSATSATAVRCLPLERVTVK